MNNEACMNPPIETRILKDCIKRFISYKQLGDKTLDVLPEEYFHVQPNPESNSIAIIIQHLHGNMKSRWTNFLTEDGEKSWRQRDEEFEEHPTLSKAQLLTLWEEGWQCLLETLEKLEPAQLHQTITIREEPLIVYDAILRQLAHYPYHVGQIVYLGRWFLGKDWQSLSIPKLKGASEAYRAAVASAQKNNQSPQ
jgi:hypothetical protein